MDVENQIKLALAEIHKDENNAMPTTIEQLNEKVNKIATNIEEINSIKKATENFIEKTYELIKVLKLKEETIYKNKVNELTSIGLGLAVSEKINEEKKIEPIVKKMKMF